MVEAVVESILESLPRDERPLCGRGSVDRDWSGSVDWYWGRSIDRRRGGRVWRRWCSGVDWRTGCCRVQGDPVEVCGVPGRGLADLSIEAGVGTDRSAEILQLVRRRVSSISLGTLTRASRDLYLWFDSDWYLPLPGHF